MKLGRSHFDQSRADAVTTGLLGSFRTIPARSLFALFRTSLLSSRIWSANAPLPHCVLAIFQRVSLSLTVYVLVVTVRRAGVEGRVVGATMDDATRAGP